MVVLVSARSASVLIAWQQASSFQALSQMHFALSGLASCYVAKHSVADFLLVACFADTAVVVL